MLHLIFFENCILLIIQIGTKESNRIDTNILIYTTDMHTIIFNTIDGEKIRTVSDDFQKNYLHMIGAQSLSETDIQQKIVMFVNAHQDFINESITLDEFALWAALLVEFTTEESGPEFDLFHATLCASALNSYVRSIPKSNKNTQDFLDAMETIKKFILKYKNTLVKHEGVRDLLL